MIEGPDVTKTYPAIGSEVLAVDTVHLEVKTGNFVLIPELPGSGKSTLPGILAGLIRLINGLIRFKRNETGNLSEAEIAGIRAKEIGFVFQFSGIIPTITALENVRLPTLFFPDGPGNQTGAIALLKKVGMSHHRDTYPRTLSSGDMKRVALVRTHINGPALIIPLRAYRRPGC